MPFAKQALLKNDPSATLPKIAGVSFEHRQGVIIAIGDHLFDKKELLKAAGFQWDKTGKSWMLRPDVA